MKYLLFLFCLISGTVVFAQERTDPAIIADTVVYKETEVDTKPEPSFNLNKFNFANIIYPETAKQKSLQGKVIIEFTVNEDGTLSDLKLIQGVGGGCTEECMRVIKIMPLWKPGIKNGKPVKVRHAHTITFKLFE